MKLPCAVIDLDVVDSNAADMLRRANGTPIRVATKSLRIPALIDYVLNKPGFSGLLAYSLSEAIDLAEAEGHDDIVVAYPSADQEALEHLASKDSLRRAITVMVDCPEHLTLIEHAANRAAKVGTDTPAIRVCIDIDASWKPLPGVHIGTRRSPVHSPRAAAHLAKEIKRFPNLQLVGAMMYEGHIAGVPDTSRLVRLMKKLSRRELARRRAKVAAQLHQLADLEFFNGGGTGSLESTCAEEAVTEAGAGSGILLPALFDDYDCLRASPAAWFGCPVVRRPTPTIATVYSGGWVSSGPANNTRWPQPPAGLKYLSTEGPGEVQTPLTGKPARLLTIGDIVWFRHAKAGELSEHVNSVTVRRGETTIDEWPTYRGLGKAY